MDQLSVLNRLDYKMLHRASGTQGLWLWAEDVTFLSPLQGLRKSAVCAEQAGLREAARLRVPPVHPRHRQEPAQAVRPSPPASAPKAPKPSKPVTEARQCWSREPLSTTHTPLRPAIGCTPSLGLCKLSRTVRCSYQPRQVASSHPRLKGHLNCTHAELNCPKQSPAYQQQMHRFEAWARSAPALWLGL